MYISMCKIIMYLSFKFYKFYMFYIFYINFIEALNFPKIDEPDSDFNFSEIKCVIHNGLRRTTLIYQSDKQEISISHRWNGVQWSFYALPI